MAETHDKFKEPAITVNGKELTTAEAMTVRVAVGLFQMSLDVDGLGDDETGQLIRDGYYRAIKSVYKKMQVE
jgi:hypothetical protein